MVRGNPWTKEEVELLKECYSKKMLMSEMLSLFPGRTAKAIQKKASDNGFQQMFPKFSNIDYNNRHEWTDEEINILECEYAKETKIQDIANMLHVSVNAVTRKASRLGLASKYVKKNNPKYTAVYQDYDWCFERYINRGMSHEQMAEEAGCTVRVMKKWCNEIHKIHANTFKDLKTINDLQAQIIMFGTLGDGHIDRREEQPMYIESHCLSEKDYLFWKYEILKDLCNYPPAYHPTGYYNFGGDREYLCEPFYRMNTRILNDLKSIRVMLRKAKILLLNELGFCLHILDDGNRDNLWHVCLAEWTQEEMDTYSSVCLEKFGLKCYQNKDSRYYCFDAKSSKKIDEMILNNLPHHLDIIHKKILDNNKIKSLAQYRYVITGDGKKVGLSSYCKQKGLGSEYERLKQIYDQMANDEIGESALLNAMR